MSKKLVLLLMFAGVLFLANSVLAARFSWTNAGGDRRWDNPENWDIGRVPANILGGDHDDTEIRSGSGLTADGPLITDGQVALMKRWLGPGTYCPGEQTLEITGGSVNPDWSDYQRIGWALGVGHVIQSGGYVNGGDTQINAGSTLTLTGGVTYRSLRCPSPYSTEAYGTPDRFVDAVFTMTGGEFYGGIECAWEQIDTPVGSLDVGPGRINIYGGTCNVTNPFVVGLNGRIDITEGVMIINGDQTAKLAVYEANDLVVAYGGQGVLSYTFDPCSNKTTVLAIPDANGAYWPTPANGETDVNPDVVLKWYPGAGAKVTGGQAVYFGTSFSDVNDSVTPTVVQDGNTWDPPTELLLGEPYFWRVDTIGVSQTWKGVVWSFTVDDGSAKNPNPADKAYDVETTSLTWTPGLHAASHDVYFGTDESPPYVTTKSLGDESYSVSLDYGQKYYWKIVEVNNTYVGGSPGPWESSVWSFETKPCKVIDDFESDANDTDLRARWDDYFADNTNGVAVTLLTSVAQANSGTKAMLYDWLSTGYAYMAATLDLPGDDWTAGNAKTLTLYFYGDHAGTGITGLDKIDFCLEVSDGTDTSTQTYGDINDVNVSEWHEWNIPLTNLSDDSVDLTNVTSLSIQIKNTGTTAGNIRVDDIRLYPSRCVLAESSLNADITGDCIVNAADYEEIHKAWLLSAEAITDPCAGHWKFDETSGDTVIDSSSNGNNGTIYNGTARVAGYKGTGALHFDGVDDYVEIPDDSNDLSLGDQSFTIAFWSKSDGGGDRTWLDMRPSSGWDIRQGGYWFRLETRTQAKPPYVDPDRYLVHNTRFNLPEWKHLAFVRDVDQDLNAYIIYLDGKFFGSNHSYYPEGEENIDTPLNTPLTIGSSSGGYAGSMDELIIYKGLALTEPQLIGIMGAAEANIPADLYESTDKIVNFMDYSVVGSEWMQKDFYP
jgi:hypothetical protein